LTEQGRWNSVAEDAAVGDIETKGAPNALTPKAAWAARPITGSSRGSTAMPPFDRHQVLLIIAEGPEVSEAIAPALRHYFADVVEEPLPELITALVEKLHAAPDPQASEESEHGPSTTPTANRTGGGG
jgi:hypothetical protein